MNQSIFFFFSIIIFIFAFFIISDLAEKHTINVLDEQAEHDIIILKTKLDEYCKDPFSVNTFSFEYKGEYKIYTNSNKICFNNTNNLLCEKTLCEIQEAIIFNENSFASTYNCQIDKNLNKLELSCN